MSVMQWLEQLNSLLHNKVPVVLITITETRGHVPRGPGARMLVTQREICGSIGGGNLEAHCIAKARAMLTGGVATPQQLSVKLNLQGGDYGVQCCGGEVRVMLEYMTSERETVAIFGAGHVGWALLGVLATLPLELYLIDSRQEQLESQALLKGFANIHKLHAPVPETVVADLPKGSHLLVMTHDHAEDIAILDVALREDNFAFMGLIGSSVKWTHFQQRLREQGHSAECLQRITTPIGLPSIAGKQPQVIAISVAAQLLQQLRLAESSF